MKAIVINKFGNALEVFEKKELPMPIIGENEILVKVVATSVNPVEYKILLLAGYVSIVLF